MNVFVISGNLTADVNVGANKAGEKMVTFSVAHNGRNNEASFFRVVTFGREAEFAEKYLKKGSSVEINGELSVTTNEKDGVKYTNLTIFAKTIGFYGNKRKDDGADKQAK